jgi:hypothetical protein
MAEDPQRYLVVADATSGWLEGAARQLRHGTVQVLLPAAADGVLRGAPEEWELLSVSEVADQDRLREEFLRFLQDWPSRPVLDGRSFDEVFRHVGGYSVWWTDPGIERNVDAGLFAELQILWALDHAIQQRQPSRIFIHTKSAAFATVLVSRCQRAQLPYEMLNGSARPRSSTWDGRTQWLLRNLRQLTLYPVKVGIRAIAARVLAKTDISHSGRDDRPAIVFTSQFSRCARVTPDGVDVWFWKALSDQLRALLPRVRCCHSTRLGREIPGYRAVSFFYHTAWPLLRKIENAVPVRERYAALGWWAQAVPRQLSALRRYAHLEAQPGFRASFSFAGADVSALYVPRVRAAVAGIAEWAQTVGATVKSLEAVGNVRAMVLYEEMYRPGMINIAAARALGIPTVGVQHGMIMPAHLIYTLPAGQVRGAPIPEYFAATSPYVKEVMSVCGAYPAERIWVTGSPRFDELIKNPPDRRQARERLGLPHDKRVILITTQTAAWFAAAVKSVFEVAATRPEWFVCVKVHPKTRGVSSDGYRSLAQQVGAGNVLCFDDQFDDLLASCDVLISASSTTILEATLLGRRTICVNFSGAPDRYPYVDDGASIAARSHSEVEQALETALSTGGSDHIEDERRRFLHRHAGPSATGGAGALLAARILDVACPDEPGREANAPLPGSDANLVSAGLRT